MGGFFTVYEYKKALAFSVFLACFIIKHGYILALPTNILNAEEIPLIGNYWVYNQTPRLGGFQKDR